MIAWRLRILLALLIAAWAVFALPAMADAPASRESLTAGPLRHVFLAGLAADNAPALQTCDPNSPEAGFAVENLQAATLPGFSGTIYQGDVINRCSAAASEISMVALFLGASNQLLGTATFQPHFGVLAPGGGSPFLAISPLPPSQVATVVPLVVRFTPIATALPKLTLKLGTPSSTASGLSVPYEVRNAGDAAAGLPRVAGRLNGPGCDSPFAIDFIADGSSIPPGGVASGNVVIPSACDGIPSVEVGTDAPLAAGVSAGLSFASVRTIYTEDGVLHLVANVCNNSAADSILPQFRARFSGPSGHLTFTLSGTGIYSGNSCAPLLATVPGAPAGLNFEALVAPSAQSAALVAAPAPRRDPLFDVWNYAPLRVLRNCSHDDLALLNDTRYNGFHGVVAITPACLEALGLLPDVIFQSSSLSSLLAAAATDTPLGITFAFNNTDSALPGSAYRVQTLGFGGDGTVAAGIDVANPPELPARGWGISVTPLDATSVIATPGDAFRIQGEGFAIPK